MICFIIHNNNYLWSVTGVKGSRHWSRTLNELEAAHHYQLYTGSGCKVETVAHYAGRSKQIFNGNDGHPHGLCHGFVDRVAKAGQLFCSSKPALWFHMPHESIVTPVSGQASTASWPAESLLRSISQKNDKIVISAGDRWWTDISPVRISHLGPLSDSASVSKRTVCRSMCSSPGLKTKCAVSEISPNNKELKFWALRCFPKL